MKMRMSSSLQATAHICINRHYNHSLYNLDQIISYKKYSGSCDLS